jgi:hypothetical protein|tara:strand:+ start:118952 stop:120094 length:1143 start_codon:yes stop_codon:yes gene_type:complete
MKKIFVSLVLVGIATSGIFAQDNANQQLPTNQRKIQMAILFDASGSMDGLLSQAKARIWSIVNELTTMRYEGTTPSIEIALYSYGNDGHPSKENYIKQLVPLSNDLDLISEQLFSITTNGGSEYCAAVISSALKELKWSTSSEDLRMIYIAGNEPFNQGPIDYKKICPDALSREIFVNTIHCGDYEIGVKHFWYDGAQLAGGDYFHIDSDKSIQYIPTPFDDSLNALNDSINKTYFGYGSLGIERKELQFVQDKNAESLSPASKAERCISKSNDNYNNSSWDLIDAFEKNKVDFAKMKDEELPTEFKGLTVNQKKELVVKKSAQRKEYQKQVAELAIERDKFLQEERLKKGAEVEDDFGTSVNKCIKIKAEKVGYTKVVN